MPAADPAGLRGVERFNSAAWTERADAVMRDLLQVKNRIPRQISPARMRAGFANHPDMIDKQVCQERK